MRFEARSIARALAVLLSIAVYVRCLFSVAFVTPNFDFDYINYDTEKSAIVTLGLGWLGVLISPFAFFGQSLIPPIAVCVAAIMLRERWRVAQTATILVACGTLIFYHVLGLASWIANPLIWISWVLLFRGKSRAASIVALSAVVFCLSFLWVGNLPLGLEDANVPVTEYREGYWFWTLSAAIMTIAAGIDTFFFRRWGIPTPLNTVVQGSAVADG